MGSACTTSGLIMGIALARELQLDAFKAQPFRIVAVPVDETLAMLQARLDLYKAWPSQFVPLTIRHTLMTSCRDLVCLGGPDLLEASLRILKDEVRGRC